MELLYSKEVGWVESLMKLVDCDLPNQISTYK